MILINVLIPDAIAYALDTGHLVGITFLFGIDKDIQVDVEHVLIRPYDEAVAGIVVAVDTRGRDGQGNLILIVVVLHV